MESQKIKQAKTKSDMKVKLTAISIVSIGLFTFIGCQEQLVSLRTLDPEYPSIVGERGAKPISANFVSEANLTDSPMKSNVEKDREYTEPSTLEIISSRYQNFPVINLKAKESWKDTYEGDGVPLLKISF